MTKKMQFTQKQHEALERAKYYYSYAAKHEVTKKFRANAIENYGFYDGTGQWRAEHINELAEFGFAPRVFNFIKPNVNSLASLDVQTRFRFAFRSDSGKPEEEELAEALTHLGYHIQESQKIPYKATARFKDMLIAGVGWCHMYKDEVNGKILYERVHPLDMLFDPDDASMDLDQSEFVIRMRWVPLSYIKRAWPQHVHHFDHKFNTVAEHVSTSGQNEQLHQRQRIELDDFYSGEGYGRRVKIVEVQYKQAAKSYEGFDVNGNYFSTFNQKHAHALAESKKDITESSSQQIMRVLFSDDVLLEHQALKPALPDMPDFSYIPSIWSRRLDGTPEGWVDSMKPMQVMYNSHLTKVTYMLNSTTVVYEEGAVGNRTPHEISKMMSNPFTAIPIVKGYEFNIQPNNKFSEGQFKMLDTILENQQRASGWHDEAMGIETNANTGVAIKERQTNSVRSQQLAFDSTKYSKSRDANKLLNLIQSGGDTFIEVRILKDEEVKTIILNVLREVNGQKVMLNDVRNLPLSIHIEEVPDFESPSQEQQATLEKLLQHKEALTFLSSPELLKRYGVRDYKQLSEDIEKSKLREAELQVQIQQMIQMPQLQLQQQQQEQEMMQQQQTQAQRQEVS